MMVREKTRNYSLLIRNLSFDTTASGVMEAFKRFGTILDVYLPLHYYTRKPRGFGFVEFDREEAVQNALKEMNGTDLDGNIISCVIAQDRRKSPQTMRILEHTKNDNKRIRDLSPRESPSTTRCRYRSPNSSGESFCRGRSSSRSYSRDYSSESIRTSDGNSYDSGRSYRRSTRSTSKHISYESRSGSLSSRSHDFSDDRSLSRRRSNYSKSTSRSPSRYRSRSRSTSSYLSTTSSYSNSYTSSHSYSASSRSRSHSNVTTDSHSSTSSSYTSKRSHHDKGKYEESADQPIKKKKLEKEQNLKQQISSTQQIRGNLSANIQKARTKQIKVCLKKDVENSNQNAHSSIDDSTGQTNKKTQRASVYNDSLSQKLGEKQISSNIGDKNELAVSQNLKKAECDSTILSSNNVLKANKISAKNLKLGKVGIKNAKGKMLENSNRKVPLCKSNTSTTVSYQNASAILRSSENIMDNTMSNLNKKKVSKQGMNQKCTLVNNTIKSKVNAELKDSKPIGKIKKIQVIYKTHNKLLANNNEQRKIVKPQQHKNNKEIQLIKDMKDKQKKEITKSETQERQEQQKEYKEVRILQVEKQKQKGKLSNLKVKCKQLEKQPSYKEKIANADVKRKIQKTNKKITNKHDKDKPNGKSCGLLHNNSKKVIRHRASNPSYVRGTSSSLIGKDLSLTSTLPIVSAPSITIPAPKSEVVESFKEVDINVPSRLAKSKKVEKKTVKKLKRPSTTTTKNVKPQKIALKTPIKNVKNTKAVTLG